MNRITKSQPIEFTSLSNAWDCANRAQRTMTVMNGDNGRFWVVGMADSQRLEAAGYEYAARL